MYFSVLSEVLRCSTCHKSVKFTETTAQAEREKTVEEGENRGITVSRDGSWRRRGFSSLFEHTAEYENWKESHEAQCEINHEGSAGKMEVNSATEMFARAQEINDVKYINYVGDGNSKTFKAILEENPDVLKKECIDHTQKRMGTRLRNLVKKTKGLSGRGKLTGKLIDKLSIYYGLAIRRHCNSIQEMKKAIWATLYHKISTDQKPQHHLCPEGEKSWCSWQSTKATAGDLQNYKHKTSMPIEVFEAVKPIYKELSRDELLTRCLDGYTQNSNESFNALVWSMAPKNISSGKIVLDTAVFLAVLYFNDGYNGVLKVMEQLGITIGEKCYNFCSEADAVRISLSERSLTEKAKAARKDATSSRKDEDQENIHLESQLYGAGIAD